MKVFLLEADSEKYQTLFPVNEDDFDVINELDGRPVGNNWSPLKVKVLVEYPEDANLLVGDFPSITVSVPIFSQNAVNRLKNVLSPNGELLPLEHTHGAYYIFNVTTVVDALNLSECDAVYFPGGRLMTVRHYVFTPDKLKELCIFKVPQLPLGPVFVTDPFVKLAQNAELEGFKFTEIWELKD